MAGILRILKSIFGFGKSESKKYELADTYMGLRTNIFSMDPAELNILRAHSAQVWGVLMETGFSKGIATLVAIADGGVSLYYSTGGGIIGVGEHEGPRKANESLLAFVPDFLKYAERTTEYPTPEQGQTRFYFLTFDGIFTAEDKADDLGNNRRPLSPLFHKAHELITQARLTQESLEDPFSALMSAVGTGNCPEVKRLIQMGAKPDSSDKTGLTPLMVAAHQGQDEALKILLGFQCKIEAQDEAGYTPLMFACNAGHLKCAELLIASGASVNAQDNQNSTPVMFAAQHGYNDIVRLLLEHKADPHATGKHGLSAIGFAKQNGLTETVKLIQETH